MERDPKPKERYLGDGDPVFGVILAVVLLGAAVIGIASWAGVVWELFWSLFR